MPPVKFPSLGFQMWADGDAPGEADLRTAQADLARLQRQEYEQKLAYETEARNYLRDRPSLFSMSETKPGQAGIPAPADRDERLGIGSLGMSRLPLDVPASAPLGPPGDQIAWAQAPIAPQVTSRRASPTEFYQNVLGDRPDMMMNPRLMDAVNKLSGGYETEARLAEAAARRQEAGSAKWHVGEDGEVLVFDPKAGAVVVGRPGQPGRSIKTLEGLAAAESQGLISQGSFAKAAQWLQAHAGGVAAAQRDPLVTESPGTGIYSRKQLEDFVRGGPAGPTAQEDVSTLGPTPGQAMPAYDTDATALPAGAAPPGQAPGRAAPAPIAQVPAAPQQPTETTMAMDAAAQDLADEGVAAPTPQQIAQRAQQNKANPTGMTAQLVSAARYRLKNRGIADPTIEQVGNEVYEMELAQRKAGAASTTLNIGASAQEKVASGRAINDMANDMLALMPKVEKSIGGPFGSNAWKEYYTKYKWGKSSPEVNQFFVTAARIKATILNNLAGAAIGPGEKAAYMESIPNLFADSGPELEAKIRATVENNIRLEKHIADVAMAKQLGVLKPPDPPGLHYSTLLGRSPLTPQGAPGTGPPGKKEPPGLRVIQQPGKKKE